MSTLITFAIEHNGLLRRVMAALTALFVLLLAAYIFFIVHSVVAVVMRKEYVVETASLHDTVGAMETAYLGEHRVITEENAEEFGLTPVVAKRFVRAENTLSLGR